MTQIAKKPTILVIDDEEEIRFLLSRRFAREGYSIYTAANGLHARQVLSSHPQIQIVISDLKMPGKDGISFIQELNQAGRQRLQFIILTGYPDQRSIIRAAKLGIAHVLLKPVEMKKILALVESISDDIKAAG